MFFTDEQLHDVMIEYKDESIELLDDMENALLEIREEGVTPERINAVFRAAHTIKGSSGMLKLDHLVEFTHIAENLLDRIRNNKITFSSEMVDIFLRSKDQMLTLVVAYANNIGEEPKDSLKASSYSIMRELEKYIGTNESSTKKSATEALVPKVNETPTIWDIRIVFGKTLLRDGMDPAHFIRFLSSLGTVTLFKCDTSAIPPLGSINPTQCYITCSISLQSNATREDIIEVFDFIGDDVTLELHPNVLQQEVIIEAPTIPTQSDFSLSLPTATSLEQESSALDARAKNNSSSEETTLSVATHTLRVDSEKIDILINLIGEMVIANANVIQKATDINNDDLIESVSIVSHMLEEIRESAMKIRMVQIGDTFNKFKRIVHDVSQRLGKEIELAINGGETEMDKTIVEKISDPLVHIIRNAIDHGLEEPKERLGNNKKAKGNLTLNAYHDAGTIAIEISDDGRGLNEEKLFAKAVEKGLVEHNAKLTQKEIFDLIFAPGFSTAAAITDISGRGVGMDVVKRNIQSLRGSIDIASTLGKGSKFTIRLPLTLAIIDGFLVRVGRTFYVIPLESVLECVELPTNNNETMNGNHYINLRGTILPILSLRTFFGEREDRGENTRNNVIIVKSGEIKFGLIVEELLGEFQTVIKPLGKIYRGVRGIGGSTILGSGEIALIIDVPILLNTISTLHQSNEKGSY